MEWEEFDEIHKKEQYLLQFRKAVRREKNILDEIQEIRADMLFPSIAIDGMPKGNSQTDLSDFVVLMSDYIEKLKKERLQKAKAKTEISEKIEEMRDEDEREVLKMYYTRDMTWKAVAREMRYSEAQIYRIRDNALKNFKL